MSPLILRGQRVNHQRDKAVLLNVQVSLERALESLNLPEGARPHYTSAYQHIFLALADLTDADDHIEALEYITGQGDGDGA